MGCRVSFCIGGGCVPTSTSVPAWVEAFGYQYDENDPLAQDYASVIGDVPSPLSSQSAWKALCEACMRTRALLFCNSSPGDAGTTQSASASSNLLGASTISGLQTEETGISIGVTVGSTIGSALGVAIPGVGQVLSGIFAAFQAHAQAEQRQSNALSQMCPYFTECIRKADAAYFSGQVSKEEAIAFLQQCVATFKSTVAPLTKSCNAFCWYNQIADSIVTISANYYQVAQVGSVEQADETTIAPTVESVVANEAATPTTSVASAVVPSSSNTLIIGLLAVIAVVLVTREMGKR